MILLIKVIIKHIISPTTVGSKNEMNVQNLLPVSFLIVNIVVLHGKWNIVNINVQIAVKVVHPLLTSKFLSSNKLL